MLDLSRATYTRTIDPTALGGLGVDSFVYCGSESEERSSASLAGVTSSTPSIDLRLNGERIARADGTASYSLYEASDLGALVDSLPGRIALDITGLDHRVWAALVRTALLRQRELLAVYAEPQEYSKSSEPLRGEVYHLSETIMGIEPLPGFARVAGSGDDRGFFAPLLGFEGARLAYVVDQEDVDLDRTFPVVGSPGFRIEYPMYSFLANRDVLSVDHLSSRVELARASCPFEAFWALKRIQSRAAGSLLRVAPLGTKPHALGAVLFAMAFPKSVELVYDHPVRSPGRTRGVRAIHLYEVSAFMEGEVSPDGAGS